MTDDPSAPLLGTASTKSRETSPYPNKQHRGPGSSSYTLSSESTPLLRHDDTREISYGTEDQRRPSASTSHDSEDPTKQRRRRWPITIAISSLIAAVLLTLVFGFAAPSAVKQYAQEAAVFTPQKISIDSATPEGVAVRIQGEFSLDGSRVGGALVRNTGRLATWVAREVETSEAQVDVYLPEYDHVLLGCVSLPAVKVIIREGQSNYIDILADFQSGDVDGIRQVADKWMSGRLNQLRVQGTANVDIRSGILKLGNQMITANRVLNG
jgi:hypothetical protein